MNNAMSHHPSGRRVFCLSLLLAGPAGAQVFFTEVTEVVGIQSVVTRTAPIGDYDLDGWPDLFRAQWEITLYHNEGRGWFTDHSWAIQDEVTPNFQRRRVSLRGL